MHMLIHQATPTHKVVIGQYLDASEARQEALRMAEKTGGRYYVAAVTGVCDRHDRVRWLDWSDTGTSWSYWRL